MADPDHPFVSRGGIKLAHALDEFALDPAGLTCADFGCHAGGFTDCLLQRGARHVYSIDTGYGVIDYKLRTDPRVTVMERTNALHADPPDSGPDGRPDGGVDLVVIDMGWTPQRRCIPAALRWLAPRDTSRIITLIKPHYEAKELGREELLDGGVLPEEAAAEIARATAESLPELGVEVLGLTKSPIRGGVTRGKKQGNVEYLALLRAEAVAQ